MVEAGGRGGWLRRAGARAWACARVRVEARREGEQLRSRVVREVADQKEKERQQKEERKARLAAKRAAREKREAEEEAARLQAEAEAASAEGVQPQPPPPEAPPSPPPSPPPARDPVTTKQQEPTVSRLGTSGSADAVPVAHPSASQTHRV